jgi:hypothetical protein
MKPEMETRATQTYHAVWTAEHAKALLDISVPASVKSVRVVKHQDPLADAPLSTARPAAALAHKALVGMWPEDETEGLIAYCEHLKQREGQLERTVSRMSSARALQAARLLKSAGMSTAEPSAQIDLWAKHRASLDPNYEFVIANSGDL